MTLRIRVALAAACLAAGALSAAEPIIIESFSDGHNNQWFQTADETWFASASKSAAEGLKASKSMFNTADATVSSARFQPDLPESGTYEVFVTYPKSGNATGVIIKVNSADGEKQFTQDQNGRDLAPKVPPDRWISLGTFRFEKGTSGYVEISDPGTGTRANEREPNARVYADAVKFVPAGASAVASAPAAPGTSAAAAPAAALPPLAALSATPTSPAVMPVLDGGSPAGQALSSLGAGASAMPKPSMSEDEVKAKLALTNARLDAAAALMEGRTPPPIPESGLEAPLPPPPSAPAGLPALPSAPADLPALPSVGTESPLPGLAALPSAAAAPSLPRLDQPQAQAAAPAPAAARSGLPPLASASASAPAPASVAGLPSLGGATGSAPGLPALAPPPAAELADAAGVSGPPGLLPPLTGGSPLPLSGAGASLPPPPSGAPALPLLGEPSSNAPPLASLPAGMPQEPSAGLAPATRTSAVSPPPTSAARATSLPNSTLPWMLDMGMASEAARNSGRNVLILFVAPGNRVVERLDRDFFESPTMKDLLSKFVLTRVNFVNNSRVAYRLGVYGAGTIAVTTPNGEPVKTVVEIPPSPDELAKILSDSATARP